MKLGTLYHGFGGWDIGAEAACLTPAWGIEWNGDIAQVARQNLGNHIITADVTTANPSDYEKVDWLHASPPCPNFSVAKQGNGRGETESDLAHAHAVVRFLDYHQPKVFTLENVVAYRKSKSLKIIYRGLQDHGYFFDATNVCASKMGVPQTRNRLIVRAVKGGLLPPIQLSTSQGCWLDAIVDLVDGLEDTQFADWQKAMLPEEFKKSCLFGNGGFDGQCVSRADGEPSFTVTSNMNGRLKAFIMTGQNGGNSIGSTDAQGQPFFTVSASQKAAYRAMLPDSRIVKIDSRCLARWQTFPDWYKLPASAGLAGRGIGNAVPCEMARRIVEPLFQAVTS